MGEHDPLDTGGQQRAKDAKAIRERLARETEEADVRWLMGTRRGRRIVWRLLERAGVFRTSFSANAMQMAFAEGNRNAGIVLLAQVHELCPDQYPLMVAEANE